jgi:hypothetical protein
MSGDELVRIDTNILPKSKLLVVFAGLAFALLVAFIDQNQSGLLYPPSEQICMQQLQFLGQGRRA